MKIFCEEFFNILLLCRINAYRLFDCSRITCNVARRDVPHRATQHVPPTPATRSSLARIAYFCPRVSSVQKIVEFCTIDYQILTCLQPCAGPRKTSKSGLFCLIFGVPFLDVMRIIWPKYLHGHCTSRFYFL